jgi:4a-hydroxytetrahydrobiopterin dehydratase
MNKWEETTKGIEKVFKFKNFLKAIDFVNAVAKVSEAANHHPDILIHSYNQVKITSLTHSENQITSKDHQLAEQVDEIFNQTF